MPRYCTPFLVALIMITFSGTARADGGIGLRLSIPLFSLSAQASDHRLGIRAPAPRTAYGEFAVQPGDAAWPALADPAHALDAFAPGLSLYYGWSQGDSASRDPRLYQLVPPSASDAHTLGLQFAYPF